MSKQSLFEHCCLVEKALYDASQVRNNNEVTIVQNHNSTVPTRMEKHEGTRYITRTVYYLSDLHLEHRIVNAFPNGATNSEIKAFIERTAENLLRNTDFTQGMWGAAALIIGGDTAASFGIASIFYTALSRLLNDPSETERILSHKPRVFVVLGNHEYWDFNSIEECVKKYAELLTPLKISLLNDKPRQFGFFRVIGGTGFAKENDKFNALDGIYGTAVTREIEIEASNQWEKAYEREVRKAKKKHEPLIVITHNPLTDWKKNGKPDGGCVYFSGHTHIDYRCQDEENGVLIFADNQIGYSERDPKFKCVDLFGRSNPFASYPDGIHEVTSDDYLAFYAYYLEYLYGNGHVETQLQKHKGKFYLIKQKGYYGFFCVSERGTFICKGGRIKRLSLDNNIKAIAGDFMEMVHMYLSLLGPYRAAEERVSNAVRAFGGTGRIHGAIIDIDFFNHIILNPLDGSLQYYSSPAPGVVKRYSSLGELLQHEGKELYPAYLEISGKTEDEIAAVEVPKEESISMKDSVYAVSRWIYQIQRLFDDKVLREWDEELLKEIRNHVPEHLLQGRNDYAGQQRL